MLNKTNLFAFGFMLFSFNLFSQEITEEKPKLKNEIAIDASPILGAVFRQAGLPGLVYRRHFNNAAFRAKVNFSFDKGTQDRSSTGTYYNSDSPQPYDNQYTSVELSIGLQKGKDISEKWKFYYGFDLFAGLSSGKYEGTTQYQGGNSFNGSTYIGFSTQKNTSNSKHAGISPFVGFTWQVAERLGFSIEASVPVGYYSSTSVHTSSNSGNFWADKNSSNNFKARIVPVSNLLISYRF